MWRKDEQKCNGFPMYRAIHKSLRDFRPLRYSSRDGHAGGEHVNRGRYIPKFLSYLTGARYAPVCCVCLSRCTADLGSYGGTYELPCRMCGLHCAGFRQTEVCLALLQGSEIFCTEFYANLPPKNMRITLRWVNLLVFIEYKITQYVLVRIQLY
jgi:hypothetical protein